MTTRFHLRFDDDSPDIESLKCFIQGSLERYHLSGIYETEDIIMKACDRKQEPIVPNSVVEICSAWLKTTCIEIIKELSKQRQNKQKFDIAIQALFDIRNPEAKSFWASVARMLRQFRLHNTYDVKEIVAEAYSRGIRKIESGTIIEKPLPWLRTTCLYVIHELRRKQDQVENPKLDPAGLILPDEALANLSLNEEIETIRLALAQLSPEEREILHARFVENRSWQEIGESLPGAAEHGLSANAARQRGFRILQKLRQIFEQIRRTGG
ncbi:MAG: hypothetical protein Kow00121_06790 [Elainellaceae cyanobacterium]